MSLAKILEVKRLEKKMTIMALADKANMSYGKVFRILRGRLKKVVPENLKQLSSALDLDYHFLFEQAGYIKLPKKDANGIIALPVLTWDYCKLAFPFKGGIHAGLSDHHYEIAQSITDGFAIRIDRNHEALPYFSEGDMLVCDPHASLENNDQVIYCDAENQNFYFGIVQQKDNQLRVISLHQDRLRNALELDACFESPIVGVIKCHEKAS